MKRALVIDGNNFYNISFYSAKGDAEYVAIRFFELIGESYKQQEDEIEFLFVVWDSKENKRKEKCPHYKGTRPEKPDGFYDMMSYVCDTLEMRQVQQYAKSGYEADDIIAEIVNMCNKKNYAVTIASTDHDMYQLLSDTVSIYDTRLKRLVEAYHIKEKYGIEPNQWKFVRALMGDSSDNISGVKGIGEKGALKIIQTYGDLDSVYASDMKELPKGIVNKLKKFNDDDKYDAKVAAYESLDLLTFLPLELEYPADADITPIKVNNSIFIGIE